MRDLIAAVGPELAWYQPAQRYHVVDERRLAEDDLPGDNLMTSVVRLEQSRSAADLAHVLASLSATLSNLRETELRRVFVDWVRRLAERLAPPGAGSPPMRTLEELKMTLEERVAEWPKQWLREGIEQGVKQGIEQGVKQGIEQGLAQQRTLLRRQAALRFGDETAARAGSSPAASASVRESTSAVARESCASTTARPRRPAGGPPACWPAAPSTTSTAVPTTTRGPRR